MRGAGARRVKGCDLAANNSARLRRRRVHRNHRQAGEGRRWLGAAAGPGWERGRVPGAARGDQTCGGLGLAPAALFRAPLPACGAGAALRKGLGRGAGGRGDWTTPHVVWSGLGGLYSMVVLWPMLASIGAANFTMLLQGCGRGANWHPPHECPQLLTPTADLTAHPTCPSAAGLNWPAQRGGLPARPARGGCSSCGELF